MTTARIAARSTGKGKDTAAGVIADAGENEESVQPYRWTVETFYRAIESGLFAHPERLELIRGEIIERMSPQKNPHSYSVLQVYDALDEGFAPDCNVRAQMPLDLGQETEPEPDVVVVQGTRRDYAHRKPTAADVRLLVEVSDTTLRYDRTTKAALYAEAGIPEYWVLDLKGRKLHVFRDPTPLKTEQGAAEAGQASLEHFSYRTLTVYSEQETVTPLRAPDTTDGTKTALLVADLLPRLPQTPPTNE